VESILRVARYPGTIRGHSGFRLPEAYLFR
jgi:hypothetical protein